MIILTRRKPEIYSRVQTPGDYTGISLELFKKHLKWEVSDMSEDDLMTAYLLSATVQAEQYTRRIISRATWRTYLDSFYDFDFDVMPIDLTTGLSVHYFNDANVDTILATNKYTLINNGDDYARLEFESDLPELYDRSQPVYVEYLAGETTYPSALVPIIMQYAADLFENRTNDIPGGLDQVTFGFHQRLFPYKLL